MSPNGVTSEGYKTRNLLRWVHLCKRVTDFLSSCRRARHSVGGTTAPVFPRTVRHSINNSAGGPSRASFKSFNLRSIIKEMDSLVTGTCSSVLHSSFGLCAQSGRDPAAVRPVWGNPPVSKHANILETSGFLNGRPVWVWNQGF